MRTALYRHYDASGALLYVGISISAMARLAAHHSSAWMDEIARVDVQNFDTREEALAAEASAIRSERPLHNRQHNVTPDAPAAVQIMGRWPSRKALAADMMLPLAAIHKWFARGRIPGEYDLRIVTAARARGFSVTFEELARTRAADLGNAA